MNFKTKVAYSAVLATLGLAAGSAQAAYLSEQGTGQVLLYPYYSVQGGMDTYVSVVNTTSRAKAVKVRFIEGRGSNEVLDFNLYLSAKDVWNAAVTTTNAADPLAAAKIVTNDKSCTVPAIPAGGQAFRNAQYTSTAVVGQAQLGTGLNRTREGYVEIIEMGVPGNTVAVNGTRTFENSVTHNSAGVPNDCAWVQGKFGGVSTTVPVTVAGLELGPRTGGLIGTGTLINVNQGVDYSYDPVAIEDYNTNAAENLHFAPGSLQPALSDAEPVSAVIDGVGTAGRRMLTTEWNFAPLPRIPRLDAISAVLMRSNVMNEYTIDPDLAAGTDWVVTFPTKRLYIGATDGTTTRPFTKGAGPSTSSSWLACEPVSFARYNREEAVKSGDVDFSPAPSTGTSLCYESNVITFAGKNVLGSENVKNNIEDVFNNGWIDMTFTNAQAMSGTGATTASNFATGNTSPASAVYYGLPVIGFAVQKYVNGTFNGAVGNYGGAYAHKYVRTVQ